MTGAPGESGDVRRVLMDRARMQAERDRLREPRRVLPIVLAGIAAAGLVLAVLLGFDAFLTSMQKFLEVEVTDPEPAATEPMPAFVVDGESATSSQSTPETTAQPAPQISPSAPVDAGE